MSQHTIEWTDSEQPSTAVAETIAELTNCEIHDLPPLQNTIDVDALDALLSRRKADANTDVQVQFQYEGFVLSFAAKNSRIVISNPAESTSSSEF